jgi:hypothetical protein
MFAPASNRNRETFATIPGRSGQETNSRSRPGATTAAVTTPGAAPGVLELRDPPQVLRASVDLAGGEALDALGSELLDAV